MIKKRSFMRTNSCIIIIVTVILFCQSVKVFGDTSQLDTDKIRESHPRLFFNDDSFPSVRARALRQESLIYRQTRKKMDDLDKELANESEIELRDLGIESAEAAFLFLITEQERYLDLAKKCIDIRR
jgi:hypothetical protein